MASHYETLGVTRSATPAMVKAGFQAKMKALQESGLDEAARAAREKSLQQAFVTLFNPAEKAKYDRTLQTAAAVRFVEPVEPHEVQETNPLVMGGAVVVIAAAVAAGWYVTRPSAERQLKERQEDARNNVRGRFETSAPNKNPNPFRNTPDSERKDRMIKQAIERDAKKQ